MPYRSRRTYRKRRPSTTYRRRNTRMRRVPARSNKRGKFPKKNSRLVSSRIPGLMTGFPDVMYTKLKYFENNYRFELPAGENLNQMAIQINNPIDPYAHLGGKTALYYGTYIGVYKYCRVVAAKVTITFNKITDSNQSMIFAMYPKDNAVSFGDIDDVCAQPRVKVITKVPNRLGDSKKFSYYIPIHVALQMTKFQYMAQLPGSEYDCVGNSSPLNPAFMNLHWGRTAEGNTTVLQYQGTVKIIFYCKFYTRVSQQQPGTDVNEDIVDLGEIELDDILPTPLELPESETPTDPVFVT